MNYCPKCFASLEDAAYICRAPHCSRAGVPVLDEDIPRDEQNNPLCSGCGVKMTSKACCVCGFALSADELDTLSLSFVGARGSGKSNYISVLMEQLKTDFCKVYGCSLYPTGGDLTMDYFERQYRRPLYEQGVCAGATAQEDIDPLTYTLLFPPGSETGKPTGLILYDAAGENFEGEYLMARYNRSLYNSQGILFMIEPGQLPVMSEYFKAKGLPITDSDAETALLRTIHFIRTGLGMDNVSKKIPVPIAVCLTKMDTVVPYLDPASFVKDSSRNLRRPMLSTSDVSACNLETQSLIEIWGGSGFLGHIKNHFSDYSFFTLSALGSQPGEGGEILRITPHRVLDPLLWLLWRNQIIRAG